MFPTVFLASFINGYTDAVLKARENKQQTINYVGMRIDLTKWICSYCDGTNTIESSCRNCGAPESRGKRNFEGLPFTKSTYYYPAIIKENLI